MGKPITNSVGFDDAPFAHSHFCTISFQWKVTPPRSIAAWSACETFPV